MFIHSNLLLYDLALKNTRPLHGFIYKAAFVCCVYISLLPLQLICDIGCQRLQKTVNRTEFSSWKPPAGCCLGRHLNSLHSSRVTVGFLEALHASSGCSAGLKRSLLYLQAAGNYPAHLQCLIWAAVEMWLTAEFELKQMSNECVLTIIGPPTARRSPLPSSSPSFICWSSNSAFVDWEDQTNEKDASTEQLMTIN